MTPEVQRWLEGQIDAIEKLTSAVQKTLDCHSLAAARELCLIEYACNRAKGELREIAKKAGVA